MGIQWRVRRAPGISVTQHYLPEPVVEEVGQWMTLARVSEQSEKGRRKMVPCGTPASVGRRMWRSWRRREGWLVWWLRA